MNLLQEILSKIQFTEEIDFDQTNEKIFELDYPLIEKYKKHNISHKKYIENYQYRKRTDYENYVCLDIEIKKESSQEVLNIIKEILLNFKKGKIEKSHIMKVKEKNVFHSVNIDQTTRLDLVRVNESLVIQVVRHDGRLYNNEKG
ncbi:MAG: hypothetical protein JXR50_00320 [Prolixibacteraceae bacterium]|nr:hypothetical protein [Prolixibacteraceae bacterium]MBN2648166.1 hypothetical protein [Prolixibacteraceae bacterium]